jgi:DNA-directed RNA polymerase subunit F
MIKNKEPLSMVEVVQYAKDNETCNAEIVGFIKKFVKLKKPKEIKDKLEKLDLMKMKTEHIVKISDLMPGNQEELNKIFAGVSLDEDETKKILETIKEFK